MSDNPGLLPAWANQGMRSTNGEPAVPAWVKQLPLIRRELRGATTVGQLFALAATLACERHGFERAVVLSVHGRRLTSESSDPLVDPASDLLRRRVLREPLELASDTVEVELVRRPGIGARTGPRTTVGPALGIAAPVLAAIAPEARALALLVADRGEADASADDLGAVASLAALVENGVERLVLRARAHEVDAELRQLVGAAHALLTEVVRSPIALPSDRGRGEAFPRPIAGSGTPGELRALLSEREVEIALLMMRGLSNKQIAEQLVVSAETVKAWVPRVLRKLGAANRVEAAAITARLVDA